MDPSYRLCYFTYGVGSGHYHYALNLLHALHEADPDRQIDVFYPGTDEDSHFPDFVNEHHFVYTGYDSKLLMVLRTFFLQFKVLAYFLFVLPDVVHANTHLRTQWYTFYVSVVLKLLRIPLVRTVHEPTNRRLRSINPLGPTFVWLHFRLASALIVHTEAMAAEYAERELETPVSVIPHGNYCCFRRYMDEDAGSPYCATDGPVVLFFGVKEHKGIARFIDALGHTSSEFEPWVVGPVNDGDEAYARTAQSDDGICTELGYIPDKDLWRYFHFADIIAMPYESGTTSGALHIALAFENAVIVSDLPCFTEYVADDVTAVVLADRTPTRLAEAIDGLVTNPTYRDRLAAAGFELEGSERFDWYQIAARTESVYESVGAA